MTKTIRRLRGRMAIAFTLGFAGLVNPGHAVAAPATAAEPIFGVNMSFYNAQDKLVTSEATRRMLAKTLEILR